MSTEMNDPRRFDPVRSRLGALPPVAPPDALRTRLRVLASREAARRRRWSSPAALLSFFTGRAGLFIDNLMRPYAVPFTGGLVSSVLLFSMLLSNYPATGPIEGDVPTPVLTSPGLLSAFAYSVTGEDGEDIVVDVSVDYQGRVTGYSFPNGQRWASDPVTRRGLENTLLYTKFRAATRFGQPSSGRARIIIVRSQMDVIG
jgi:hypothetical protein